jgi:hypothetical protein
MVELGNGSGIAPAPWKETMVTEFAAGIARIEDRYIVSFRYPDGTTVSYNFGPLLLASLFGQYERLRDDDGTA